jgi:hypothetical protein
MSVFDANSVGRGRIDSRREQCSWTFWILLNALTVTIKRYIMQSSIGTQKQIDDPSERVAFSFTDDACAPLRTDQYVPFRTDEQLWSLVDRQFWKSRLFGGLP